MPILVRPTLARYFETGKALSNAGFNALVDSIANLQATTAQDFRSDVSMTALVGNVSANEASLRDRALVSAAMFSGGFRQGVSAGTSAQSTLGFPVVSQEGTVAAATTQFANLPGGSHIIGLSVKVLAPSSAAAGGTVLTFGNAAAGDFYGSVTVSAAGSYPVTNVCANRLADVSGAVLAFAPTASALSSFLPTVQYYSFAPLSAAAGAGPCSCITAYPTLGDRTAQITVTTNITWGAGTNDNLVDGAGGANGSDSVDAPDPTPLADGDFIRFDYGSAPKYVDEIKISKIGSGDNGAWKVFGGNSLPPSNQLASFTWDSITETVPLTSNLDSYRFYEIRKDGSGTWANEWIQEFEFKECTCP